MRWLEKQVLLQAVDTRWREHLWHLDQLRSVIHLRGYAQRDPLNEFKNEAFTLFERLLSDLRSDVTRLLMRGQFVVEQPPGRRCRQCPPAPRRSRSPPARRPRRRRPLRRSSSAAVRRVARPHGPATPRNAPCPCGSGKRYKNCHGDVTAARLTQA